MPVKRANAKGKTHFSETLDSSPLQHCVLTISDGTDIYGTLVVELNSIVAPKTCEAITQNIVSSNAAEKGRSRQGFYRNCGFRRMSKEGLQTGCVTPPAKPIPEGDLEGEIGNLSHQWGVLSLCRSAASFDGSQFFICITEDPVELQYLNKRHPAFGTIIKGRDVLRKLLKDLEQYTGDFGVVSEGCPYTMAELSFS